MAGKVQNIPETHSTYVLNTFRCILEIMLTSFGLAYCLGNVDTFSGIVQTLQVNGPVTREIFFVAKSILQKYSPIDYDDKTLLYRLQRVIKMKTFLASYLAR